MTGAVLTAGAAFWVLRAYRNAGGGASSARPALAVCVGVAIAGLGIYLAIGNPELPGASYAARLEALKQRDVSTFTADEALAVLADRARRSPDDALPHLYSGQVLMRIGRPQEAIRAFDAALRRDPLLPEALLGMGRAMVAVEGGAISPEALALFQQAGDLSNDPTPWIYQAMAAMEQNRDREARDMWGEALARMPPDDPRREMAQRMSTGG